MSLLISLKMFLSTTVEILQEYTLWVNTYSKLTIRATSICLVYFPYVPPKFQGKSAPLVLIESINNQEQHLCRNERAQNSVIIYLVYSEAWNLTQLNLVELNFNHSWSISSFFFFCFVCFFVKKENTATLIPHSFTVFSLALFISDKRKLLYMSIMKLLS